MVKTISKILFTTAFMLLLVGCKSDLDGYFLDSTMLEIRVNGLKEDMLTLNNSLSNDLEIVCNDEWFIKEKPSWLIICPNSGTGSQSITLRASGLSYLAERDSVFVVAAGNRKIPINVHQSRTMVVFNISEDSLHFRAIENEDKTLSVGCNAHWKVLSKPLWCNIFRPAEGTPNESVIVKVNCSDATEYEKLKDNIIIFSPDDPSTRRSIPITLDAKPFLYASKKDIDLKPEGESLPFSVEANVDYYIEKEPNWFRIEKDTIDNKVLILRAEPNDTGEPRNFTLILRPYDDNLYNIGIVWKMNIHQDPLNK